MILRALYDLAQQEGLAEDLDYEPIQIRYAFVLGPKGATATIQDRAVLIPAEGKKQAEIRKPTIPVPRRSGRRSNDCAEFLVDKSDYLLGWDPSGKTSPEKSAVRHSLYRVFVEKALAAQEDGSQELEALQALLAFLNQDLESRIRPLQDALERCSSGKDQTELASAFFSVEYAQVPQSPIHLLPGIRSYWKSTRIEVGSGNAQCLVTGQLCAPTEKHPPLKNVPGGNTAGAALVSFNSNAFLSYGQDGNATAPIGRNASEAIGNALNRLLSRTPAKPDGTLLKKQHVRLSADTVALFWAEGDPDLAWVERFAEDPDVVEAMLLSPQTGRKPAIEDPSAFHMLVLSGAQGRALVRAYGCRTTASVAQEVQRYLAQARILRPYKGEGVYPLRTYLRSLAALGEEKNLSPQLAGGLYMAILEGRPFPRMILDAALRRNHAEGPVGEAFAARCGLIRAYFLRNRDIAKEITVSLDPNKQEHGYLLGRLLATLDKLQQDALGSVNATLVDRYYGSASTTPGAVFPALIRRSQHHLGKLRKEKPGLAITQEKLLQNICSSLDHFEKTLPLEQQGFFALGFHHQRQDFFTKKEDPSN